MLVIVKNTFHVKTIFEAVKYPKMGLVIPTVLLPVVNVWTIFGHTPT